MPCNLYNFFHLGTISPTPAEWLTGNIDEDSSEEDIGFEDEFFDSIRPRRIRWTRDNNTLLQCPSWFEIVGIVELRIIILQFQLVYNYPRYRASLVSYGILFITDPHHSFVFNSHQIHRIAAMEVGAQVTNRLSQNG